MIRESSPHSRPAWTTQSSKQYAYDGLGRSTIITNTDGTNVRGYYSDRKTAVLDELNHQTIQESDAFGRLSSARQYMGTYAGEPNWDAAAYATAQYQYDVADRLTQVVDPISATTYITYNLAGWKINMTDADMGTWRYGYDTVGNLNRQMDARGKGICFAYDAHNRLTSKTFTDTVPNFDALICAGTPDMVAYTYDSTTNGNQGIGRRTGMTDASGSAAWVYDARGRVISKTKSITGSGSFVTRWAYDAADRVKTMTYPIGNTGAPNGEAVNYTYDAAGQPFSTIGQNIYVHSTTYNSLGQPLLRFLGSSAPVLKQSYTYTQTYRLSNLVGGASPNYDNHQKLSYTYDSKGNVRYITDTASLMGSTQVQTYTYDALDRLATAKVSGGTAGSYSQVSYVYNAAGNTTTFEGAALTYTDTAHAHGVTGVGGVKKYWYDANGNVTRRISGTLDITLTYDYDNRLTNISGTKSFTYTYDGDGRLVKITSGIYITAVVGSYYEYAGSTPKKHYFAGATRIATRDNTTLFFLLTDHLGSTALTTNNAGARTAELRYYAYGLDRYETTAQRTDYRFTGQRIENSLDIYNYGARWYDPVVGRFLQADTIVPNPGNPQGLNRYTYVGNNPLRYTDPTGHWEVEEDPEDHPSYAQQTANWLYQQYGIDMTGNWSGPEAAAVRGGVIATDTRVREYGGAGALRQMLGGAGGPRLLRTYPIADWARGVIRSVSNQQSDFPRSFTGAVRDLGNYVVFIGPFSKETVIHELAHMIDYMGGQRRPTALPSIILPPGRT